MVNSYLYRTPLHEAVSNMHSIAIKFLLHKGADPKIMNGSNETPYDLGKRIGLSTILLDELFSNLLIKFRITRT
jgi:ankyrin repeat protein